MESNIYIHIGFPKCASTTLQRELFANLSGFYFHKVSDPRDCQSLGLSDSPSKTIISNESFVRNLAASDLLSVYPDAHIILIVREPESYYRSLYSQYSKGHGIKYDRRVSPDEWIITALDNRVYEKALDYLEAFPKNTVLSFEALVAVPDQFAATLAETLGIEKNVVIMALTKKLNKRQSKPAQFRRTIRARSPLLAKLLYSKAFSPVRRRLKHLINESSFEVDFSERSKSMIESQTGESFAKLKSYFV